MKVVSLFSGCGGLDLGFHEEGYKLIWANDFLADACASYARNISDHIVCEDILKINEKDIPTADIILGGPPCQSFSLVGKRDPTDMRGMMVWKYLDIIEMQRPKLFIMENVTGIKSARASNGALVINQLTEAFTRLGYHTDIYTLNAADYGVPQRRKRVFVVGNRLGITVSPPRPTHSDENGLLLPWVTSSEALSDLSAPAVTGEAKYSKEPSNRYQALMRRRRRNQYSLHIEPYSSPKDLEIIRHIPQGGNYMNVPDAIATKRILNFKRTGGRTTTYGRLDPKRPAYTLNTHFNRPNVGCNIHYDDDRMITIREGLRLQSFPDHFELISKNMRNYYVQVGNAVPVELGRAWATHLRDIIAPPKKAVRQLEKNLKI